MFKSYQRLIIETGGNIGQTFPANYIKEPSISDGTGCVKFIYSKKATKFCGLLRIYELFSENKDVSL